MPHVSKETATPGSFKNNDIYMINDEESDTYEEPKERNLRVMYKLNMSKDPTSKNMPHKKSSMMRTMSQLKKKKQQCEDPSF